MAIPQVPVRLNAKVDKWRRTAIQPAPPAHGSTPSPFVVQCLKALPQASDKVALDLGCGYGRHVSLLGSLGYTVFALDLAHSRLRTLLPSSYRRKGRLHLLVADTTANLPLKAGRFDLVVAVHCLIHANLPAIHAALRPGGLLIYETFGGQGMNWLELPKVGCLRSKLKARFEILTLQERAVGPASSRSVAARLLARKR